MFEKILNSELFWKIVNFLSYTILIIMWLGVALIFYMFLALPFLKQ